MKTNLGHNIMTALYTFIFLNIQSLKTHKVLFEHLLLEEKATAFALNETFLTPKYKPTIKGYIMHRHDGPRDCLRANGGTAVAFKPNIPHRIIEMPKNLNLPEHNVTLLYLKHRTIAFATIYVRPGKPLPIDFIRYISDKYRHFIIMADINFHSRSKRAKSKFLDDIETNTHGEFIILPKPTRPVSQTTPDAVIISQTLITYSTIDVLDPIGSDHVPIKLQLEFPGAIQQTQNTRKIYRYTDAKWDDYRETIENKLQTIEEPTTPESLDETVDIITQTLKSAAEKHIPTTTITPHKPKLPPQYLNLIAASRRAHREYTRTHNLEALRLHRAYLRMTNNYLKAYKTRQWIKVCNSLGETSHPTKYWKTFHRLTGKTQRTPYPIIVDNQSPQTDIDKANTFANHFQDIFTPLPDCYMPIRVGNLIRQHSDPNSETLRPSINNRLPPNNPLTRPITMVEINQVAGRKRNTAPGFDTITYKLIKEAPPTFITILTTIYTFILRTGYFPIDWKYSKVLLFPKPNKPTSEITSYRPIQLTSTLSKILEKIIVNRLHEHLNENNLLPISQAGFRPNYSISDQLLRLTTAISNQFNKSLPSCLLTFDLEKAFDKVWHAGLLHKLHSFMLPECYIRYIHSFLTNRMAYISINESLSHPILLKSGVPQGSSLSPLLYLLYVADLPEIPNNVQTFQFADDTAFLALAPTIQGINRLLQNTIDSFSKWCRTWKLTINSGKTQTVVFLPPKSRSRTQRNPRKLNITVHGVPIKPSKTVKYLGVIFDTKLTWTPQLNHIVTKAKNRLNLLKRLVGTTWGLKPHTLINTYKVFMRPTLSHGHIAWLSAPIEFYEKLAIMERHALRLAYRIKLPSPTRLLYERIDFPHIRQHLEKIRTKYILKHIPESHPIILDIFQQDAENDSPAVYHNTAFDHLITLYCLTLAPNHPDQDIFAIYRPQELSQDIYPSQAQ